MMNQLRIVITAGIMCAMVQTTTGQVSPDSIANEFFMVATKAYQNRDYQKAIVYYKKLFNREQKRPTLIHPWWYVMIDNYGMACGVSGNLDEAEKVFRFGIAKDSLYALFPFNLACVYAERNDLDQCLFWLARAFRNKDHVLEGEDLPDPMQDDSFQRYLGDERFVGAVRKMKKGE